MGCPREPQLLEKCISRSVPVPTLRLLVELGWPVDCSNVTARVASGIYSGEYRTAVLEWLDELPPPPHQQQQNTK
ncbi:hypothetical protein PLESTB_000594200 [Pleodorina starrii]|uniref:Uncharacterized protein n=1 Tax=Pleodorina starrii TaxID=330485 RepID=A0A9W6F1D1_9CHLO|nr:hypothetical protein PLESTB_000594200 [Pleodorina starrii]